MQVLFCPLARSTACDGSVGQSQCAVAAFLSLFKPRFQGFSGAFKEPVEGLEAQTGLCRRSVALDIENGISLLLDGNVTPNVLYLLGICGRMWHVNPIHMLKHLTRSG